MPSFCECALIALRVRSHALASAHSQARECALIFLSLSTCKFMVMCVEVKIPLLLVEKTVRKTKKCPIIAIRSGNDQSKCRCTSD